MIGRKDPGERLERLHLGGVGIATRRAVEHVLHRDKSIQQRVYHSLAQMRIPQKEHRQTHVLIAVVDVHMHGPRKPPEKTLPNRQEHLRTGSPRLQTTHPLVVVEIGHPRQKVYPRPLRHIPIQRHRRAAHLCFKLLKCHRSLTRLHMKRYHRTLGSKRKIPQLGGIVKGRTT
jgi:hypothetical protein